eukprot:gene26055-34660_t
MPPKKKPAAKKPKEKRKIIVIPPDSTLPKTVFTAATARTSTMMHTVITSDIRKIDINALELRVVCGYAAIHYACLNNSVPMLELLLQSGADKGFIDCAKVLMKHGASLDITDNFKNNAAFWAYKNRHEVMIRELQLPAIRSATAEDLLEIMKKRVPGFTLPSLTKKKKEKKKPGK